MAGENATAEWRQARTRLTGRRKSFRFTPAELNAVPPRGTALAVQATV
jgi:hypothetical protein